MARRTDLPRDTVPAEDAGGAEVVLALERLIDDCESLKANAALIRNNPHFHHLCAELVKAPDMHRIGLILMLASLSLLANEADRTARLVDAVARKCPDMRAHAFGGAPAPGGEP